MSDPKAPTRVVPYLTMSGRAREAIDTWTRAFGAKEIAAYGAPDNLQHAEVEINGGSVFLTDMSMDAGHAFQPTPSIAMHLAVPDGRQWMERAAAGGCTVLSPWQEMSFGGYGRVTDPFGVIWAIATPNELQG